MNIFYLPRIPAPAPPSAPLSSVFSEPIISPSLTYYINQLTNGQEDRVEKEKEIPETKYSLSSKLFFELVEIFHLLNLESYFHPSPAQSYHIGYFLPDYSDTIFFFQWMKNKRLALDSSPSASGKTDHSIANDHHWVNEIPTNPCLHYLFFEFGACTSLSLPELVVATQSKGGMGVFKLDNVITTQKIRILFWLVKSYQQVIWIKPSISHPTTRFWIAKNYLANSPPQPLLNQPIPLFFLNKIEEINNILGQELLETRRIKSKIDLTLWCERFRIK
jgi:hypothetical protein